MPVAAHRPTGPSLIIVLVLALTCAGCGANADRTSPATTIPATTVPATTIPATTVPATTIPATTVQPTTSSIESGDRAPLRGARYCEVLLLRPIDGTPTAEVYNTYPLNDCPDATWRALDPTTVAAAAGVPLAILNGPRYWLMDEIEPPAGDPPAPVAFGGMEMTLRATVDISSIGAADSPYTAHNVDRRAVFGYSPGSTVYELVAPDGSIYVMQSWSQQVDPTLDEAALAGLGARLQVPSGWSYRTRVLTEPLRVVTTDTDAVVLQDELKNSYSQETGTA